MHNIFTEFQDELQILRSASGDSACANSRGLNRTVVELRSAASSAERSIRYLTYPVDIDSLIYSSVRSVDL